MQQQSRKSFIFQVSSAHPRGTSIFEMGWSADVAPSYTRHPAREMVAANRRHHEEIAGAGTRAVSDVDAKSAG